MFNVNTSPSSPKVYTNPLNNHAQPSTNQMTANLQVVINIPLEPITIRNLPQEIIEDKIAKYLDISDIKNFNKADIYPKISPYRDKIKELRHWQKECPIGTEENRKLAVERIIDCIEKKEKVLNLSYLNLTSLPDLKSLEFIMGLDYKGNDSQPILDCFEQTKYTHLNDYVLKKSSFLPKNITGITLNHTSNTFKSGYYLLNFFKLQIVTDERRLGAFSKYVSISHYTENFKKDFLHLYRL